METAIVQNVPPAHCLLRTQHRAPPTASMRSTRNTANLEIGIRLWHINIASLVADNILTPNQLNCVPLEVPHAGPDQKAKEHHENEANEKAQKGNLTGARSNLENTLYLK